MAELLVHSYLHPFPSLAIYIHNDPNADFSAFLSVLDRLTGLMGSLSTITLQVVVNIYI